MHKKIAVNYLFNVLYQIVAMLIPLITTPYVSKVLGAEGIGTISYVSAISSYVIILCTYGTSTYACRMIAYYQKDKDAQSKVFWELILLRGITIVSGLTIYVFYAIYISDYKTLMLINSLLLLAEFFDISWLFNGNEDFTTTAIRAIIVKLVGVCFVFLCVRAASDLWKYAFKCFF